MRRERDRSLAGRPHHILQHPQRGRASVLGARTKRRVGVVGVRPLGQRQALEPRQPTAGALEHPGAATCVGGEAPWGEILIFILNFNLARNELVRPAAAQVVHEQAIGEREIYHAVAADGEIGGTLVQPQSRDRVGQMRARDHHGAHVAIRVGLIDPARQAAVCIERARHALERAGGGGERGAEVGWSGKRALARQPQHAAMAIPHSAAARREMAPVGQQPEAESVGVHQHSSGTTGTATASGSA